MQVFDTGVLLKEEIHNYDMDEVFAILFELLMRLLRLKGYRKNIDESYYE